MCLYPKLILNPKYRASKKNKGIIPPMIDQRVKYVPIGCQECMECRKQKARNWQARIMEDIKTNTNGKFITLTFNNDNYTKLLQEINTNYPEIKGYALDNAIATIATRRFLERWRKEYKKSLRHWFVTELGHQGTENIHLHGIIWTDEHLDKVESHWKYGMIWKGQKSNGQITNFVNDKTASYITKYVHKRDDAHKHYKSIILTSPGIGNNYSKTLNAKNNAFNENKTIETFRTRSGYKIALPIYWRNQIFTEQQREKLWLHRLNKQERWICGERIDISKGEDEYYKTLKFYQTKNIELGYNSDTINWEERNYEKQRRQMMQEERVKKAKIQQHKKHRQDLVNKKLNVTGDTYSWKNLSITWINTSREYTEYIKSITKKICRLGASPL